MAANLSYEKKTPLPLEVPSELGQNEICLLLTLSSGHKEVSEQTSPKVAAHLALPPSDKVEFRGKGPRGVLKARKTAARPPKSCPNRLFVFAVDAVQERAFFAPTATFVALDLPFPPSVEVVKFWGVLWCLCVLGRADRALELGQI